MTSLIATAGLACGFKVEGFRFWVEGLGLGRMSCFSLHSYCIHPNSENPNKGAPNRASSAGEACNKSPEREDSCVQVTTLGSPKALKP